MSKKNRERRPDPPPAAPPGPITYTTALKPQRKLLVIISVIFALWVALLMTLYFTTIYPTRHERTLPSSVDNPP
jgi:hypothetical protein